MGTAMAADRPLFGIVLMIGFCLMAPLGDGIAKILGASIPLLQLLLVRFVMQALLLLPIIWWLGLPVGMSPRVLGLTIYRAALHIVGIGAMFMSLRYLPLADAVAIAFVMPFIMLLLGKLVLKEEVGARRLGACVVGFIGTVLVIQPSFATVGPPALLPLVVAVVFALFMLATRQVAKEIDPVSLQGVSGVIATTMLGALVAVGWWLGWPEVEPVMPSPVEAALLVAIGVLGTVAHLFMTWSLKFAPAATLAPMQYLEIPFATLIGWLIFADLPNGLAALGIAITVLSGLYIILRERVSHRRAVAEIAP